MLRAPVEACLLEKDARRLVEVLTYLSSPFHVGSEANGPKPVKIVRKWREESIGCSGVTKQEMVVVREQERFSN